MFESHLKPPISFPTLTGNIVTFNAQYALPLKSHKIALTATQSGSGTPSPDNVRPISGYNAINISQSGADTSTPTVYVINLGGTYYGGEYDAITGVLTVTHKGIQFNDASLSWNYNPTYHVFYTYITERLTTPDPTGIDSNYLLEQYNPVIKGYTDLLNYESCGYVSTKSVNIRDERYSSTTDFLNNEGTQKICYPLAIPTTIQLPPCPIDVLEGVNNIWADTGDTNLQYPKFG